MQFKTVFSKQKCGASNLTVLLLMHRKTTIQSDMGSKLNNKMNLGPRTTDIRKTVFLLDLYDRPLILRCKLIVTLSIDKLSSRKKIKRPISLYTPYIAWRSWFCFVSVAEGLREYLRYGASDEKSGDRHFIRYHLMYPSNSIC
jgi:hypothetical protein